MQDEEVQGIRPDHRHQEEKEGSAMEGRQPPVRQTVRSSTTVVLFLWPPGLLLPLVLPCRCMGFCVGTAIRAWRSRKRRAATA